MKLRSFVVVVTTVAASFALLALVALLAGARIDGAGSPARAAVPAREGELIARLAISIPFGIDDVATLDATGSQVTVSGHGGCEAGAETFELRVWVTQGSNRAPATGATSWRCSNAGAWQVFAQTPPPFTFVPGPAEVCPMAIVEVQQDGNVVRNRASWGCQEVMLTEGTAIP
jgi:hypothetical protein